MAELLSTDSVLERLDGDPNDRPATPERAGKIPNKQQQVSRTAAGHCMLITVNVAS